MRSTLASYIEFRESIIWQDIKRIFLERLSLVRDELEMIQSSNPNEQMLIDAVNKGRAEELRFASGIVDYIIEKWEEIKKEEGGDNGRE